MNSIRSVMALFLFFSVCNSIALTAQGFDPVHFALVDMSPIGYPFSIPIYKAKSADRFAAEPLFLVSTAQATQAVSGQSEVRVQFFLNHEEFRKEISAILSELQTTPIYPEQIEILPIEWLRITTSRSGCNYSYENTDTIAHEHFLEATFKCADTIDANSFLNDVKQGVLVFKISVAFKSFSKINSVSVEVSSSTILDYLNVSESAGSALLTMAQNSQLKKDVATSIRMMIQEISYEPAPSFVTGISQESIDNLVEKIAGKFLDEVSRRTESIVLDEASLNEAVRKYGEFAQGLSVKKISAEYSEKSNALEREWREFSDKQIDLYRKNKDYNISENTSELENLVQKERAISAGASYAGIGAKFGKSSADKAHELFKTAAMSQNESEQETDAKNRFIRDRCEAVSSLTKDHYEFTGSNVIIKSVRLSYIDVANVKKSESRVFEIAREYAKTSIVRRDRPCTIPKFPPHDVVEDFVGRDQSSIVNIKDITRKFVSVRDERQHDTVLKQEPEAGKILRYGKRIVVHVGRLSDADKIVVPNFLGQSSDGLEARFVDTKLIITRRETEATKIEQIDRIIAQSIAAETKVAPGTRIELSIGRGRIVPNYVGMEEDGINSDVFKFEKAYQISKKVGLVLNQEPAAGSKVPARSNIRLIIGREAHQKTRYADVEFLVAGWDDGNRDSVKCSENMFQGSTTLNRGQNTVLPALKEGESIAEVLDAEFLKIVDGKDHVNWTEVKVTPSLVGGTIRVDLIIPKDKRASVNGPAQSFQIKYKASVKIVWKE